MGSAEETVETSEPYIDTHVHTTVEHPNQEGDACNSVRSSGLMAESVYGGDIQSIDTNH